MNKRYEDRKVRTNLTNEEKARLEKFGVISFKSPRGPRKYDQPVKFIPSREQH